MQCDEAGRLCGCDLTTATIDDRNLLDPLTRWMKDGIVVGDGGYLSQAKAKELAHHGVYLLTATRKNIRHMVSFSWRVFSCASAWKNLSRFSRTPLGSSARPIAQHMHYRFTCWAVYYSNFTGWDA